MEVPCPCVDGHWGRGWIFVVPEVGRTAAVSVVSQMLVCYIRDAKTKELSRDDPLDWFEDDQCSITTYHL